MANFIPYKGHKKLIKICSKIVTKKKWKLFLIGEDRENYKKKLVEYIHNSNSKKNVIFFNPSIRMHDFYKAADFAVSSSTEEGSSNFLLESIHMDFQLFHIMLVEIKSFIMVEMVF